MMRTAEARIGGRTQSDIESRIVPWNGGRLPSRDTHDGNVRGGGWDPYLTPEALPCGNAARLYNDGELAPPADPPGNMDDLEERNQVHWDA